VKPSRYYPGNFAIHVRRRHDLVLQQWRLLDRGQHDAGCHLIADLNDRRNIPLFVSVKHWHRGAWHDVHALFFEQRIKRAPNAVEEAAYQPRAYFNRKRLSGADNDLSCLKTVRVFVYLYGGVVLFHLDDFAHQLLGSDVHNFAHGEFAHIRSFDDRAVDEGDDAFVSWGR
jgi:hypothetical protein